MDPYQSKKMAKYQKNGVALFLLVMLGCGIVFFAIVQMACSFVVNFADDFETDKGDGLEATIQSRLSYAQYWAGIPHLVTGILVVCSGIIQRTRGLTITTVIFSIGSIFITFFVVALDGGNWYMWNSTYRMKMYWDAKSGYTCANSVSTPSSCECTKTGAVTRPIGTIGTIKVQCDEISELSSLYGAVVGSSIIVAFLSTFVVLIIAKSLSWKKIRHGPSYRDYYVDDYRMDNSRRVPSVVDLPYGKRPQDYEDRPPPQGGPPYKQTIYRNYPY